MTAGARTAATEDRLLDGRVKLLQAPEGYRVAIDPVILAAAVPARAGETALDLGCGTGAAALCLLARVPGVAVTGLECDPATVALARDNAAANRVSDNFRILEGEVQAPPQALRAARFDHVLINPPYLDPARARLPRDADRRRSHGETAVGLTEWLDLGLRRLRDEGTLSVIHRAERLDDILAVLDGRTGDVVIFPLWPGGPDPKPAKRVVVRARKGSRAPLRLDPGLVLHRPGGDYTAAAETVLRDAAALPI